MIKSAHLVYDDKNAFFCFGRRGDQTFVEFRNDSFIGNLVNKFHHKDYLKKDFKYMKEWEWFIFFF